MADFLIRLKGENAQLRAQIAQVEADLRRMHAAASSVNIGGGGRGGGGAPGSSGPQTAAQAAASAQQVANAQARAAAQLDAQRSRALASQAAAQERASARAVAIKAREAAQIEAIESRYLAREYQGRVAFEARKERASQQAAVAAQRRAQAEADANARAVESSNVLAGSVAAVAAQFGLIGGAAAVVSSIGDAFTRANADVMEAVHFLADYRAKILELAALKGQLGESTKAIAEDVGFRAQTLQTQGDARKYQEAALGIGQSFVGAQGQVGISKEEYEKLIVMGGKFQTIEGGDAAAHGKLIGLMPALMNKQVTAEEAFGQEQKMYNIMQPGGFPFASGIEQLAKNASYINEGLYDADKLTALTSAYSVTEPQSAAERVRQFTRATSGGLGRLKGVKVEGDSEKVGAYLKGLGADNQTDSIGIGQLVAADLLAKKEKAHAQGKIFNQMEYLVHKGYGGQEEREALMGFTKSVESGQWKTFTDLADRPVAGGEAMDKVNARLAADPSAQRRGTELSGEMVKLKTAAGANEYYNELFERTFNIMKGEEAGDFPTPWQVAGEYKDVAGPGAWATPGNLMVQKRVRDRAEQFLREQAVKVGLAETPEEYEVIPRGRAYERVEAFHERAEEIAKAGGQILPGIAPLAAETQEKLRAATGLESSVETSARAESARERAGGLPPMPGAPPGLFEPTPPSFLGGPAPAAGAAAAGGDGAMLGVMVEIRDRLPAPGGKPVPARVPGPQPPPRPVGAAVLR